MEPFLTLVACDPLLPVQQVLLEIRPVLVLAKRTLDVLIDHPVQKELRLARVDAAPNRSDGRRIVRHRQGSLVGAENLD